MNVAIATVRPNSLNHCPVWLPMKPTGTNTAMIDMEVAKTAKPISDVPKREASI